MAVLNLELNKLGKIQCHKNLAVFPVLGESSCLDYLVLSEILGRGVEIKENPKGTTQNQIYVENNTNKIVLAISGEIVVGQTQNRNFVRNVIFDINFKGLVPVNCAQAGHSTVNRAVFNEYGGLAPSSVSNSQQSGAWDTIATLNSETRVFSGTSDLKEIYEKRKETFEEFSRNYSKLEKQLGIVAGFVRNGKKHFVLDVFDNERTFGKYFNSLLKSYILESGLNSEERINVSNDEVEKFLNDSRKSEFKEINPISLGKDFKFKGNNLMGSSIVYEWTPVHTNIFSSFGGDSVRDYFHREIDECPTILYRKL